LKSLFACPGLSLLGAEPLVKFDCVVKFPQLKIWFLPAPVPVIILNEDVPPSSDGKFGNGVNTSPYENP